MPNCTKISKRLRPQTAPQMQIKFLETHSKRVLGTRRAHFMVPAVDPTAVMGHLKNRLFLWKTSDKPTPTLNIAGHTYGEGNIYITCHKLFELWESIYTNQGKSFHEPLILKVNVGQRLSLKVSNALNILVHSKPSNMMP